MKISGSIRRTNRTFGRSVASRESPPLFTFQDGTARPGPGAHLSGPGYFLAIGPPKMFCAVPKSVPRRCTFASYFIPVERKSRLGATRSNFHE